MQDGYNDEYATCEETYATLRFINEDGSPKVVTDLLQVTPTRRTTKGEDHIWAEGEWRARPNNRPAKMSSWSLCTRRRLCSRDARRHIDHLLDQLAGKDSAVAQLRHQGWQGEITVFWVSKSGHGGPTLHPACMSRLGQLGLTLWFDVYFNESEASPEVLENHLY